MKFCNERNKTIFQSGKHDHISSLNYLEETPERFCEICEILKSIFFNRTPLVAAFKQTLRLEWRMTFEFYATAMGFEPTNT